MSERSPQRPERKVPTMYKEVVEKPRPCASDAELRDFINEENLTPAQRAQLEHHIQGCDTCKTKITKVLAGVINQDNVAQLSAETRGFSNRVVGDGDTKNVMDKKAQRVDPANIADAPRRPEEKAVKHVLKHLLAALQDGRLIPDDLDSDDQNHINECNECAFYVLEGAAAKHGIMTANLLALYKGSLNSESTKTIEAHLMECRECSSFYRKVIARHTMSLRKKAAVAKSGEATKNAAPQSGPQAKGGMELSEALKLRTGQGGDAKARVGVSENRDS